MTTSSKGSLVSNLVWIGGTKFFPPVIFTFVLAELIFACSPEREQKTSAAIHALEEETCGNGVLDLHPVPPPDCPDPSVVTEVINRTQLDAWLSDPTTSLRIKASMAFSDEALVLSTACDVFAVSAVEMTGLTDLFISARRIDLYADIQAAGRLDFRAGQSIVIRQYSNIEGPVQTVTLEGPTVDDHGDAAFARLYCIEAGDIIVRQASRNGTAGGNVKILGDDIDVHGDFLSPGNVAIHSGGNMIFRQAAVVSGAGSVSMTAGAFLDFHGKLLAAGSIDLEGEEFFYRDAAVIDGCGAITIHVTGSSLVDFYGDMLNSGNLMMSVPSLYLRQSGKITSNGNVELAIGGRYDQRGEITSNAGVLIATGTYKLYPGHDLSGNGSCLITGEKTADSVDAIGCVESQDISIPTWPAGSALTASNVLATSLTLTWTEAVDDVGVASYRLLKDGLEMAVLDASAITYEVTGLAPETTFSFKVEAGDAAGNWSTDGPSVMIATAADTSAPAWPPGSRLAASEIGTTSLVVTWTPAQDDVGVASYRVFQDGVEIATVDSATLSLEITGLAPDTLYLFKVEASDASGNWSTDGPALSAATTPDITPPYWPEGSTLTAFNVSTASLSLAWTEAHDDVAVAYYRIFMDGVMLADVPGAVFDFNVSGLSPNSPHFFKVEAGDAHDNWSVDGPSVSVTTAPDLTPPAWPDGSVLLATDITPTSLTLAWTPAVDDIGLVQYRLYKNGEILATVDGSVLTYPVSGLTPETSYTFKVEAGDGSGNWSLDGPSALVTTPPPPDLEPPAWPDGSALAASDIMESSLTLTWTEAVDNVGVVSYRLYRDGVEISTLDGSTHSHLVFGLVAETAYSFKVEAADGTGNWSTDGPSATVTTTMHLPPDPAEVAPPLDRTVATNVFTATEFVFTGDDPIQREMEPGTIEPVRVALVSGKVMQADGTPLPGVIITVKDHPEYGYTLSRLDGIFNMVVNGGGEVILSYEKAGYLNVHRHVDVQWQDYAWADDVVLIQPDPQTSFIDLSETEVFQVARGSEITDVDGTRQATILVPPGTTAEMVLPDGTRLPMSTMNVHITEYTVGENGPEAMPAELPPSVLYTYCVEFNALEAEAVGAQGIFFNQPVYNYVENFVGFPVGTAVPTGYYDRSLGEWVASHDGLVVEILGITGGMADMDLDGDGVADGTEALETLGITPEERASLAQLYSIGQSLWRVPIPHFTTPWDHNWPYIWPDDAIYPNGRDPKRLADYSNDDPCETAGGSVIKCHNLVLDESLNLTGTPYSLHYSSEREKGQKSNFSMKINLRGPDIPPSLKRIEVDIYIAGNLRQHKSFGKPFPLAYYYTWDGKGLGGRTVQGTQKARVKIGFVYNAEYTASEFNSVRPISFGSYSSASTSSSAMGITARYGAQEIVLWREWDAKIGGWDFEPFSLGGWNIDKQHMYDMYDGELYLGNGDRRTVQSLSTIVETVAGNGGWGYSEGVPATQTGLYMPFSVAVDSEGILYIADTEHMAVRRVDRDGIISTLATFPHYVQDLAVGDDGKVYVTGVTCNCVKVIDADGTVSLFAGNGTPGFSGDWGPATEAKLYSPHGVAVGPDGSVYIADVYNHRIRMVGTSGVIVTVAGNGGVGAVSEGQPAIESKMMYPMDVDVDRYGNIFIAAYYNHRILKAGTDGIINTVAGMGISGGWGGGFSGDGGLAVDALLNGPNGVEVDDEGRIFIVDSNNYRIRMVNGNGIINTLAGNGSYYFSGDGGPSTSAGMNPSRTAVNQEGIFFADRYGNRIRKIHHPLAGYTYEDVLVPSENGSEVYHFDWSGRHLATLDGLSGASLFIFGYGSDGLLDTIADGDGNLTAIERDTDRNIQAVVSPYGQRTEIGLDDNGFLNEMTIPNDLSLEQHGFTYDGTGGLLATHTTPRHFTYQYDYDDMGRLIRDTDPVSPPDSVVTLDLTLDDDLPDTKSGYLVEKTTAEGRMTSYLTEFQTDDSIRFLNTFPSGHQTESTRKQDSSQSILYPDGTGVTLSYSPDPRWDMRSPILGSLGITTPAGLTYSMTSSRETLLENPADVFSLNSIDDTTVINGKTFTSSFNPVLSLWTRTSPLGRVHLTKVDEQGRIVFDRFAGLQPVGFTYDANGRLSAVTQGTWPEQRVFIIAYNSQGFVQSITDPEDGVTSFEYDGAGRVVRQVLPDSREILYSYDENGNISSITPPGKPGHVFTYTPVDLTGIYVPPEVGAGTNSTHYFYNLDRQIERLTRPDGLSIDYGYDTAGRLASIAIPGKTIIYGYDPATGNLASIANGEETVAYSYDGSLLTDTVWSGEISGSVHRAYNNDFNIVSRSVNGMEAVGFGYDADGLLTQAGDLVIGRNLENGMITGTTLGSVTTASGYNGYGELESFNSSQGGSSLYQTSYTHDNLGRITQLEETLHGTTTTYTYAYDDAGRLEDVWENLVKVSHYDYYPNGNRLRHVTPEGTTEGTYDAQDRMLSYGFNTYTYTDNGELLTKTIGSFTFTYTYDVLGNLVLVDFPTGRTIEYVIDGLNRRIGKKVNGILLQGFLYRDALNPVAELDGSGNIVSEFVYGTKINVPDYMVRDGETHRIVSDHLGSPKLVVNVDTGEIVQEMKYDEFGNVLLDTNPGFQPFGFAGGIYDRDTGLVRFGARDYDPETGRWTAKDPILFTLDDTNVFSYTDNNPLYSIDPSGLWYIDFNLAAPIPKIWPLGPVVGVQISSEGVYPYIGGGAITSQGAAITATSCDASSDWYWGAQVGFGIGAQFGQGRKSDWYWEGGIVTPGASFTLMKVWEIWKWDEIL